MLTPTRKWRMRQHDASSSEDEIPQAERETFLSRNGTFKWSSVAYHKQGRMAEHKVMEMTPGPTTHAVSHAHDIASTSSYLFITPAKEKIILGMTNLEGFRKYGDGRKRMDETDLHAYIGLLIVAGVCRSRGEAAAGLWDAESGRAIFHATMPPKLFHAYSRLIRFDDRESRPARRATDKLAAIREVWDKWARRLPYLYNPGPDLTVDEQLVPFRSIYIHFTFTPTTTVVSYLPKKNENVVLLSTLHTQRLKIAIARTGSQSSS
ncbi:hypothetical protein N1851_009489 [Merluccius polli]|uniref:PiggyBac transposable element-derived protein domain-containing protein n=1 Tax=Merluccius polli TaxID=89951 RepID=A0AA47N158_MERPO|nr:hypothetical protein N1851_009489 [Merluccius polli]